jgi:hypothetical protein
MRYDVPTTATIRRLLGYNTCHNPEKVLLTYSIMARYKPIFLMSDLSQFSVISIVNPFFLPGMAGAQFDMIPLRILMLRFNLINFMTCTCNTSHVANSFVLESAATSSVN